MTSDASTPAAGTAPPDVTTLDIASQVVELKIWAERRAGEMLREMERSKGGRPKPYHDGTVLSDLGINRRQIEMKQKLLDGREEVVKKVDAMKPSHHPPQEVATSAGAAISSDRRPIHIPRRITDDQADTR